MKTHTKKRMTLESIEVIKTLREKGLSSYAIARRTGYGQSTCARVVQADFDLDKYMEIIRKAKNKTVTPTRQLVTAEGMMKMRIWFERTGSSLMVSKRTGFNLSTVKTAKAAGFDLDKYHAYMNEKRYNSALRHQPKATFRTTIMVPKKEAEPDAIQKPGTFSVELFAINHKLDLIMAEMMRKPEKKRGFFSRLFSPAPMENQDY